MLFVSGIESINPYKKLVTVVDTETGEVVGQVTYGDSVSERHMRMMAPSLITKSKRNKREKPTDE